jgi:hypothetical protein
MSPPPKPSTPEPQLTPFRPVSPRQRRWIVLLTLATVALLAVLMLQPSRELALAKARRAEAAARAACPPGAASIAPGCPGGPMSVIVLQAASPGAAASR